MRSDDVPQVAICIPVRGPGADLGRVLHAIERDHWPKGRRVVIVVLDGPDPELEALAEAHSARTVVLESSVGSYGARNAAIDALPAEADFVLFTDADCIPQPGWVAAHIAALQGPCDLSGGAIDVTLRDRPSPAEYVDKLRHLHQEAYVTRDGYAATANLALRRAVAALRFDGSLLSGGDAEFCRRAVKAGYRLRYTPLAVVQHPARRTAKELTTKVRRICCGIRSSPDQWVSRPIPGVRLPHHVIARARRDAASGGLLWDLVAARLQMFADIRIVMAVLNAKRDGRRLARTGEVR